MTLVVQHKLARVLIARSKLGDTHAPIEPPEASHATLSTAPCRGDVREPYS